MLKNSKPPISKPLMRMRVAGAGEPVFKARARLSDLVHRLGFPEDARDAILLAFSEALSNAILYGSAPLRKSVRVLARMENSRLVLEVSDHGSGFRPEKIELPDPRNMEEGGRGLFLMRALMDDVQWHDTPHGTTVRMVKCCGATAPVLEPAPAAAQPTYPLPVA